MKHQDKDLLRYRDLEAMGYGSRTTIWRAVKSQTFPFPHDDGRGNPVWFKEDIETWKAGLNTFQSKQSNNLPSAATA